MADQPLRTTALTALHESAGARMAPFAGWSMPVEFAGTIAEHTAVREAVGVFDVSHLGTVFVTGNRAAEVVGGAFTCDPTRVAQGASQYTLCCDEGGGIVDDLIVYHLAPDRWMVVPNAANTAAVVARLEDTARAAGKVMVDDESADRAVLAIQGPQALGVATSVLGHDVADIPYLELTELTEGEWAGGVVARTGYTGEPGCEVVIPNHLAPALWERLVDQDAEPCGLGARDTLRLEMGYPLHGHELSPQVLPHQARLRWAVKLDHEFVGRDALAGAFEQAPSRRLWGLRGHGRRPLRAGLTVRRGDVALGTVTSGSFSPTLEVGIGLAMLDEPVTEGEPLVVDVRGRDVPVEVVRSPFVDRDPKRSAGV